MIVYKIGFKFDGKNGFGGTANHTAVCEISKDKKLLAISIEQLNFDIKPTR